MGLHGKEELNSRLFQRCELLREDLLAEHHGAQRSGAEMQGDLCIRTCEGPVMRQLQWVVLHT